MANNYIPQVDYTSRDYESLRQELIDLIPFFAPKWTNRDPADFGMTIVELFTYIGDQLNYYIDRSVNESFITTASQRDNVLKLARLLGYQPIDSTAASVLLTFSNSTAQTIIVPKRTQVATSQISSGQQVQVIFETDEAVTVPAKAANVNGSITVTATQGESRGYGIDEDNGKIGDSDGSPYQTFQIPESPVVNNSIEIYVSGVKFTQVPYLIDYQGYDPVFSVVTNSDGETFVQFGDNISGRIPNNGAEIFAYYRVGGGTIGNVSAGSIKFILTNFVAGLAVGNPTVGETSGAASGGADPESTDSIRVNAPKSIRSLNRAVSLADYSALAIQVPGVAKAVSDADVFSSVTLFIAPYGDSGLQVDGITSSVVFNNLAEEVLDYFTDKIPPGVSLTLQPPSYVDVRIKLDCVILSQYKRSQVEANIVAAINQLFDFDNVSFNDSIYPSDLYKVLGEVEGISRTTLSRMLRKDEDKVFSINNKALTSNVATLTTSATHNYKIGDTVLISGVGAPFNGTSVITGVTSNTFTYALINDNVTSAAVSPVGTSKLVIVKDILCAKRELPQLETTRNAGVITVVGLELGVTGGIS
jgi:hypothetical protein